MAASCAVLAPILAWAGPCDITWDGDAIARNVRGRGLIEGIRLLGPDKSVYVVLTGAQILAVAEAKNEISRQLGRSPSLIFCSDKAPNAFAMNTAQGDVVGVTVGLATLINGDRDMAAFVIGHEYAHLVLGHMAAAEQRRALLSLFGELVGAFLEVKTQTRTHVQGLGMNTALVAASMVSYKFDRDQEREADRTGFGYMVSAGFSPLGAVRVADLMQRYGSAGIGLFFDNHPGWPERAERFRALINDSPQVQAALARTGPMTALVTTSTNSGRTQVAPVPTYAATDAERAYGDGIAALGEGNWQSGVALLRSSAAAGYAPAQTKLGYLYGEGRAGLPKDEAEAVRLYRLAAAQSNPYAMYNMAGMYMGGRGGLAKNEVEVVSWWQMAAKEGFAPAIYNLGVAYSVGYGGLPKDETKAAELYKQAADSGLSEAQNNLGIMYLNGQGGLVKNPTEALRLFHLSAARGNPEGQYLLGTVYDNGADGVAKDLQLAASWYQKAAAQGHHRAIQRLKVLDSSAPSLGPAATPSH